MLRNLLTGFVLGLFGGVISVVLERLAIKLYKKYSKPWHVQCGHLRNKIDRKGTPLFQYMKWECVNGYGYSLDFAIRILRSRRNMDGGEHYRLRNWRTREIIPGEALLE